MKQSILNYIIKKCCLSVLILSALSITGCSSNSSKTDTETSTSSFKKDISNKDNTKDNSVNKESKIEANQNIVEPQLDTNSETQTDDTPITDMPITDTPITDTPTNNNSVDSAKSTSDQSAKTQQPSHSHSWNPVYRTETRYREVKTTMSTGHEETHTLIGFNRLGESENEEWWRTHRACIQPNTAEYSTYIMQCSCGKYLYSTSEAQAHHDEVMKLVEENNDDLDILEQHAGSSTGPVYTFTAWVFDVPEDEEHVYDRFDHTICYVTTQEPYEEQVIDHYECSCGATK